MLTYTGRRNLYGQYTNDTSTANLSLGDTFMNEYESELIAKKAWPFLETSKSISSVANQQNYDIPAEAERVHSIKITINGNTKVPRLSPTRQHWDRLNAGISTSSDFAEWFFIWDGEIHLWPIPSTSVSNAITVFFRKKHRDLSIADYTTGGILTATAASASIVGTGTSWTAGYAGFWLRITRDAAANKGDGRWYEVSSIGSTTTMTLAKPYSGTSIAAGNAAYTLGEVGLLPEAYQKIPVLRGAEDYFRSIQPEGQQHNDFRDKADKLEAAFYAAYGNEIDDPVIEQEEDLRFTNPNDYPTLS